MENQNRFDLEKALRLWREDCGSRPGISFEDARELESDLRERVADLQKQGLVESEAFRQAVRQVGAPADLAREFARENPVALWRQRLLWMAAAGFAVSIWQLMSGGAIYWFFQTFGVLLPLSFSAWATLAGNLPVLGVAVLLATGKLEPLGTRLRCLLHNRQHLVLTGAGLIAAGILTRVFGPCPLRVSGGPGLIALFLLQLSLWPVFLLSVAVFLFKPLPATEIAGSASSMRSVPRVVWRERVCWMAVGGLISGFWQTASLLGMKVLFYTGDIDRPFKVGLVFTGVYLLIQFSPIIFLGSFLRQRMRAGRDVTGGRLLRKPVLVALLPVFVCAWTALHLWSEYMWIPRGFGLSLPGLLANYFTTLRWFWPVCLASLVLWLAPSRSKARWDSEFAS